MRLTRLLGALSTFKWAAPTPPPSLRIQIPVRSPRLCVFTKHVFILVGNDMIEEQLKRERLAAKNQIKILLLGAEGSNKVDRLSHCPSRMFLEGIQQFWL